MDWTKKIVVATTALLFASGADALILENKSPGQKVRRDIGKQLSKYATCLGNALRQCEKGTDPFTAECSLAAGSVTPPGDPKGRWMADLTKCDDKLDFMKKAKTNVVEAWESIGCPGDESDTDLEDFQYNRIAALNTQIDQLALLRSPGFNKCDASCAGEPAKKIAKCEDKCVGDFIKRFRKMTVGIAKCIDQCENDYKDKKGNGGPTDDTTNCEVALESIGQDANFFACTEKVFEKAEKKAAWPEGFGTILGIVIAQMNDQVIESYNAPSNCP